MRLSHKALLIISLVFAGTLLIVYAMSEGIILGGFSKLEQADAQQNASRAVNAFERELQFLNATNIDWSAWDDTYNFVTRRNTNFLKVNLIDETFVRLELNMMIVLDAGGKVIYSKAFDLNKKVKTEIPPEVLHLIATRPDMTRMQNEHDSKTGFMILDKTPLLLSFRPIVQSSYRGPIAGTYMLGKYIGPRELEALSQKASLKIDFAIAGALAQTEANPRGVTVQRIDDNSIAAYTVLDDIFGTPALTVNVTLNRAIYAEGKKTLLYFMYTLLAVAVLSVAIMWWLLQDNVISRLAGLGNHLAAIRSSGSHSARIPVEGSDELHDLGVLINEMLEALQKQSNQQLALLKKAIDSIPVGVTIADVDKKIVYANHAEASMHGYAVNELIGKDVKIFTKPNAQYDQLDCDMDTWREWTRESRDIRKDGTEFPVELRSLVIKEAGIPKYILTISEDITLRKSLEDDLRQRAMYDSLTGLPNRFLMFDRLKLMHDAALRDKSKTFALVVIDLDNFKKINDSMGHIIGDRLLVSVSHCLSKAVRTIDTVSRLGGDEFALLLTNLKDKQEALIIVDRLQHDLKTPIEIDNYRVVTSASIGIAFNDFSKSAEDMYRDADSAMYQAKVSGRSTYKVFTQEMYFRAVQSMELEIDLRGAIERDEFEIHYQPIINSLNSNIMGFEALVRWMHPVKGMISPADFIPMCEETGVIKELGKWIVHEVCKTYSKVMDAIDHDRFMQVHINLSVKQLDTDLPALIEAATSQNNLHPSRIVLEVTEGMLVDNLINANELLQGLRSSGYSICLDDFGTGYSSLNYLHRFPVQIIKIDKSFIKNIDADNDCREIIRAVKSIADNLGIQLIIEGVEELAQLDTLKALNCHNIQGYYFSKPLKVHSLIDLIKSTAIA